MTVKFPRGITVDTHTFTDNPLGSALKFVGDLVGVNVCYFHRGSFHFVARDEWTVAVTPESADRFRIDLCHLTRAVDRKWVMATDRARLASLVRDATEHAMSAVA